jgi:tryptophan synthase alpha chain
MSAVDQLFVELRAKNRKAFIPFVTAADPDLAFTAELVGELAKRGCSLCELGIPYSDPIADGTVIQASYTRALDGNVQLDDIFTMAKTASAGMTQQPSVAGVGTRMPLVTMVSYSIIYRRGLQQYVQDAKAAGISGAIVPDLPVEEAGPFARICQQEDFSLIQLVTPTTPRERAVRIADSSSGFLYYVSVTGITGERTDLPAELLDNVSWLREQTELPICIGFGISRVEHVRRLAPVADGLIVGSAIVRRIAEVETKGRKAVLQEVGQFVERLIDALHDDTLSF